MISFGEKNKFQIQYWPFIEQYNGHQDVIDNPNNYALGGSVFCWVNGKNIFAYKDLGPEATYTFFDLTILLKLFCDYLLYHVTDDPFPIQTKAKVGRAMMDEIKLVEGEDEIDKYHHVDWDNVNDELYSKIDAWKYKHGLLINSGGTFLPNAYIQKVDNKVEISWRNDFAFRSPKGEFYAQYKEGVEYVELKLYRDVIAEFCFELLNRMQNIYPAKADELRINLQKAIDVPL